MKSLFEEITSWSINDDFELHFNIINLKEGWEIISKIEADRVTLNKLVQWTAYCYSYDSALLRKRKERWDNKINVAEFLDIDCDSYIMDCLKNKNDKMNDFVTWWLRESSDKEFAILISGEDLLYNLLQTARTGVEKTEVTAKNERDAEKVMKMFYKTESTLKAEAYQSALKIKESIEKQMKTIERNYEYLSGVVRKEIPSINNENFNWMETITARKRKHGN